MELFMPAAGNVTVSGKNEAIRKLRGLLRVSTQQEIGNAIQFAAGPMLRDARSNVVSVQAVRSGALRDSIIAVSKINPNKETIRTIVGPDKRKVRIGQPRMSAYTNPRMIAPIARPSKYAHLVEFGTSPHPYRMRTRKGIESFTHPGTRPKPFLGPAFAANSESFIPNVGRIIGDIVERKASEAG